MKLTPEETKAIQVKAAQLINELHDLVGTTVLLLIEMEDENCSTTNYYVRGSPYSAETMARIYADIERRDSLAYKIAEACQPITPDDGEDWKEDSAP
jgi:hypothetical protein